MSTKIKTFLQVVPANRALVMGLIAILAATATTGFLWMQSDHVIAPPGLRLMNWLWRASVDVLSSLKSEMYMRALAGLI
jgi:hypothetical protein